MRVTNYEVLLNEDRIPHLVKESARNYAGNSCLTNPSQIAEFMRELYHADILPEEKLWMIAMNTKCKPLGIFELAHGSMDSAVMDQKGYMIVHINFLNKNKAEIETSLDIKAFDEHDLSSLFNNFCKENSFPRNTVTGVTVVASAVTMEELQEIDL